MTDPEHLSPARLLIVGAGLSGLALAHGLRAAGRTVTVVEKEEAAASRDQGYRIHLDAPSVDALENCLPAATFADFMRLSEPLGGGFTFLQPDLTPIAFLKKRGSSEEQQRARAISRYSLRQLLLSGQKDHVNFGKTFVSCAFDGPAPVSATFEDGTVVEADFLIGADGSGSAVVRRLLPDAVARKTGFTAVNGKVRHDDEVAALMPASPFDHVGLVVGPGPLLTFLSRQEPADKHRDLLRDDHALAPLLDPALDFSVWSLIVKDDDLPKDFDGQAGLDFAKRTVAQSDPKLRRLIDKTLAEDINPATLWSSPPFTRWAANSAWTVIGDAIHSMVPLRGRGASAAFMDCDSLRRALVSPDGGDWPARLARHERSMMRRARVGITSSRLVLSAARAGGLGRILFLSGLKIGALASASANIIDPSLDENKPAT